MFILGYPPKMVKYGAFSSKSCQMFAFVYISLRVREVLTVIHRQHINCPIQWSDVGCDSLS